MMIMEKKQFGVHMLVFVFLLSLAPLYNAKPDVAVVSNALYTPVSTGGLETDYNNKIIQARRRDKYFYIGVACAKKESDTSIQTLCSRQGSKPDGNRCGSESSHHKDVEASTSGLELTEVFYPNQLIDQTDAYSVEKKLIAKYFNSRKKDPLCLNKVAGNVRCTQAQKAIVYLRVYMYD